MSRLSVIISSPGILRGGSLLPSAALAPYFNIFVPIAPKSNPPILPNFEAIFASF
jgi:hypothetical protein